MDYNSSSTRAQTREWSTYVPAVDDVLSPPPLPAQIDHKSPTQPADGSLGFIAIIASLLVTAIIIIAMLIDGQQAGRAILVGATFFAVLVIVIAVLLTGTLSAIIAVWQRERTERARIEAYAEAAEMALQWRIRIEDNRALELQTQQPPMRQLPVDPPQTPHDGRTFVPPYREPDKTAAEALAWARSLYLDNGQPDPKMIQPDGKKRGWLRVRAIGSKRGGGTEEAGVWLRQRKFLRRVPGGYMIDLDHFPTRESLRLLR